MDRALLDKMGKLALKPIFERSDWLMSSTSHNIFDSSVNVDLLCPKCNKTKTFIGKAYSKNDLGSLYQVELQKANSGYGMPFFNMDDGPDESVDQLIDNCILEVEDAITIQLKCPTCGSKVYFCFAVESEACDNVEIGRKRYTSYKYRLEKIGEYPNQESSRLQNISKYISDFPSEHNCLVKAERAYYSGLGSGAIIYLRKAYEVMLYSVLDDNNVPHPNQFRQALEMVDKAANIVPAELKDRAYGLFGEMSDIIHGEMEDSVGLDKYELLRDVFKMLLDNILEKRKQAELAKKIKLDSAPKRGGATT